MSDGPRHPKPPVHHVLKRRVRALYDALGNLVGATPDLALAPSPVPVVVKRPRR